LPRLSDVVAPALRCAASRQRARLAENHGKPSLWVFINAPWYNVRSYGYSSRRWNDDEIPDKLLRLEILPSLGQLLEIVDAADYGVEHALINELHQFRAESGRPGSASPMSAFSQKWWSTSYGVNGLGLPGTGHSE